MPVDLWIMGVDHGVDYACLGRGDAERACDSKARDGPTEITTRVPAQMLEGEPSPGADVGGASPVPVQMWEGRAQSRRRCGSGARTHGEAGTTLMTSLRKPFP
jgi:hypothetical protein